MEPILFSTDNSWIAFILRITMGVIMLPHGMQKMFGLFGGYGFKSTMAYFTGAMKLPWIISFLIIVIELFCPLGLIIGFGSRLCALLLLIIMTGAIITTNFKHGFFMNWFGTQGGEGVECHVLVIGICIAIFLTGSGKYSIESSMDSFR